MTHTLSDRIAAAQAMVDRLVALKNEFGEIAVSTSQWGLDRYVFQSQEQTLDRVFDVEVRATCGCDYYAHVTLHAYVVAQTGNRVYVPTTWAFPTRLTPTAEGIVAGHHFQMRDREVDPEVYTYDEVDLSW